MTMAAIRDEARHLCVEQWSSNMKNKDTVEPLLGLLEKNGMVKYLHQKVLRKEEVATRLSKWGQSQYRSYGFGYLAFHGSRGRVHLGRQSISLSCRRAT